MSDLIQRCKEILAWKRTGVLPGNALRNLAEAKWKGHHDGLQLAEQTTMNEAMQAVVDSPLVQEALVKKDKRAPVQGWPQGIPWSLHLEAYAVYCQRWGAQPALIDLEGRHCRGGFSVRELDEFIPGWKERVSEITQLKAEIAELRSRLAPDPLRKPEWLTSDTPTLERQFAEFLNSRRGMNVSAVFHEAMQKFAELVGTLPAPKLIGWRTSDYLSETSDLKVAKNWEVHHELRPIFEGDPNTKLKAVPEPKEQ